MNIKLEDVDGVEAMSAYAKAVGLRLVELRGDTNQRDFAAGLDIASNTLGRYERGETFPSGEVLLQLRKRGVDLNWLFVGDDPDLRSPLTKLPPAPSLDLSEAVNAYSALHLDDFVMVPRYNVSAEGGAGIEVFEEEVIERLAFRREWLKSEGLLGLPLSLINATGDSMSPTINPGDIVLIDNSKTSFTRAGIYVLLAFGRLIIKRLDFDPLSGDISLISDNPKGKAPQIVPPDLHSQLNIRGRAVWWAPGHADM